MAKINRTVLRALQVLELLKDENKPMTLTEISIALDMPRSSAFDIIYTLTNEGFIELDNESLKTYKLGLKIFEIGASYLSSIELTSLARPFLEKLMHETGATSFLVIENNNELVYLDKVESPSSVRTTAELGSRKPMYCTGLGKALLAAYDKEKLHDILDNTTYDKLTEYTLGSKEAVLKDLEEVRTRGYSFDDREGQELVSCVAAPIYDTLGVPIAAISIATMHTNMTEDNKIKYVDLVTESAMLISKKMGYSKERLY